MKIELEEFADSGRYFVRADDSLDEVAELTYTRIDTQTISADKTYVPERFRGRGIAAQLAARLVADARGKDVKIIPRCSYVETAFNRHPEWADVRQ